MSHHILGDLKKKGASTMIVVGHDGVPRIARPVFLMMSTVELCTVSPFHHVLGHWYTEEEANGEL